MIAIVILQSIQDVDQTCQEDKKKRGRVENCGNKKNKRANSFHKFCLKKYKKRPFSLQVDCFSQ